MGPGLRRDDARALKRQHPLRWPLRLEIDPLQFEHTALRRRAAGCREAADLAAGRQDAVAGDDERDRVLRHRLTDVAGALRPHAKLVGKRAVGRRSSPPDTARRGVYLPE